jgi:hypothetical protein
LPTEPRLPSSRDLRALRHSIGLSLDFWPLPRTTTPDALRGDARATASELRHGIGWRYAPELATRYRTVGDYCRYEAAELRHAAFVRWEPWLDPHSFASEADPKGAAYWRETVAIFAP